MSVVFFSNICKPGWISWIRAKFPLESEVTLNHLALGLNLRLMHWSWAQRQQYTWDNRTSTSCTAWHWCIDHRIIFCDRREGSCRSSKPLSATRALGFMQHHFSCPSSAACRNFGRRAFEGHASQRSIALWETGSTLKISLPWPLTVSAQLDLMK